jgi:hypothetical protein
MERGDGISMKKRWLIYIIIGVLFGVFDFYYQEFTSGIVTSYAIWLIVTWGIWLVPAIPVTIYESKVSESIMMAALMNVLTWSVSVISYYMYMAFKLIFIGQTSMQFLHISHYRDQFYLSNLKSLFSGDVLDGISQWIGVAVVGGLIIGLLISYTYLRLRKFPVTNLDK